MSSRRTVLLTATAIFGWATAAYWRERSSWCSNADLDEARAQAMTDVATEDAPDDGLAGYGMTSGGVMRAAEPPDRHLPWYWYAASTDFEDDPDGIRITHFHDGWASSRTGGYEAVAGAIPVKRIDDIPEF